MFSIFSRPIVYTKCIFLRLQKYNLRKNNIEKIYSIDFPLGRYNHFKHDELFAENFKIKS